MKVTFRVFRYNPEKDRVPHHEDYEIEVPQVMTVLEGLRKIKEEIDGTLSLRSSCRQAICGSCGMRINHFTKLACRTQVADEVKKYGGVILVEPMRNMTVLKDLIVDLSPFWTHMDRLKPWLIKDPSKPVPEKEYLMAKEQVEDFFGTPNCIVCAGCHSECPAVDVDKDFPGPAALAKLYRFAIDPRDGGGRSRLDEVTKMGLWWCLRCYQCVEACPKNVRPGEVITNLREMAHRTVGVLERGGRHAEAFKQIVERFGILDEIKLARDTLGLSGTLKELPRGLKMFTRGKILLSQKPIPKIEEVRRIYEELRGRA